jgi:hypothetical protein
MEASEQIGKSRFTHTRDQSSGVGNALFARLKPTAGIMAEAQPPKQRFEVLEHLHETAASLQAFLRSGPPLTEAEQLFIENRIMMMQIEYQQASKQRPKAKHTRGGNAEEQSPS